MIRGRGEHAFSVEDSGHPRPRLPPGTTCKHFSSHPGPEVRRQSWGPKGCRVKLDVETYGLHGLNRFPALRAE